MWPMGLLLSVSSLDFKTDSIQNKLLHIESAERYMCTYHDLKNTIDLQNMEFLLEIS
jgi:hypothetical protein